MSYRLFAEDRPDRYRPCAADYTSYQRDGFLVVPQLIPEADTRALLAHTEDMLHDRVSLQGIEPMAAGATLAERLQRFLRLHMLHRVDAISERYLLHPRTLDVLEALIGPDVLALQTMLFFNPPKKGGQGWHQDAAYIPVYPDTLIGAWLALDVADEENGCLWVAPGSQNEPIHPTSDSGGWIHSDGAMRDLAIVQGTSHHDDEQNGLGPIARRYAWKPVPVNPGDVIFFHSHLLHRSYVNRSDDRFRRAFVTHYCNARSWVPWNHGAPYDGYDANAQHILARGTTHLPYAQPRFGTTCAANTPPRTILTSGQPKPAEPAPEPAAKAAPTGRQVL